jgi:hypothetical protein
VSKVAKLLHRSATIAGTEKVPAMASRSSDLHFATVFGR